MSLLRYMQDVDLGRVVALECHTCRAVHPVSVADDLYALLGDGSVLTCQQCGKAALIPRSAVAVGDRFPGAVGEQFVPVPHALLEHAGDLDLTAHMVLVIVVLESYRRASGQAVFPKVETIALRTCLSQKSVTRALDGLAGRGLVTKGPRRRRPDGTLGVTTYLLDPLWERVAELQERHRSNSPVDAGGGNSPLDKTGDDHWTNQDQPQDKTASATGLDDHAEVEPLLEEETHEEVETTSEKSADAPEQGSGADPSTDPEGEGSSTWDELEALRAARNSSEPVEWWTS